jgi:dUTP pyrophosphatase
MTVLLQNLIFTYHHLKQVYNSTTPNFNRFALLRIAVNKNNQELCDTYKAHVLAHNKAVLSDPFPNSGFDLFTPKKVVFDTDVTSKFVDLEINGEMMYCDMTTGASEYSGYLVHPRSSLSKTPLMLANHTGIIDAGYRGSLIAALRWLKSTQPPPPPPMDMEYHVEKDTRLVQICHPTLCPILVQLVEEEELSKTDRGSGGFGSTGV